ncbi:uncharacterized protein BO66DRAFT_201460 [Aspergillus aculeatinus CBS 121060]|uniref:Uncharacterized protein n=1 Tax=Aspergillus aculeatinus CBS 121060 TaxID=1448322 RepID=A0ACD1HJ58_9EURO|nr:hypothetical protein BO66DRAFT_201460 [Aspergillus aculeatinus CBS 121060]RAH73625.1 hypothetical protein BO66DRAFT_201460 [Aspergillus aculeatinus CBS 121060]
MPVSSSPCAFVSFFFFFFFFFLVRRVILSVWLTKVTLLARCSDLNILVLNEGFYHGDVWLGLKYLPILRTTRYCPHFPRLLNILTITKSGGGGGGFQHG